MNYNYFTNKFNIYVPEHIIKKIDLEAQIFEIFKKDGSINKNKLLNMLLKGYYNSYAEERINNQRIIEKELHNSILDPRERTQVAHTILKAISISIRNNTVNEIIKPLSLKPIKENVSIISGISEQQRFGDSISEYIRDLLCSYFQKPFSERERILFRDKYEIICIACQKKLALQFTTYRHPEQVHTILPYSISTGAEEMYNYILCVEKNKEGLLQTRSYRLNRITSLNLGYLEEHIPETIIRKLNLMVKYGPAFAINDEEESCVRLTRKGVEEYNNVYNGRPKYIKKIEKGSYTYLYFDCSREQLCLYFSRFNGDNAVIITPESLKKSIIEFHSKAIDAYSINNKNVKG